VRGGTVSIETGLPFQSAYEATDRQPGVRGILTTFTAGSAGELYGMVGKRARVLLAADEIDDAYPGSRALYEHGSTSAWQTEESSGGAWVAYAPGQVTRYWDVVRRPVGRIFLAGEHADLLSGTMEGAVRSGRRAATAAAAKVLR
jgi:monoamine oxidase